MVSTPQLKKNKTTKSHPILPQSDFKPPPSRNKQASSLNFQYIWLLSSLLMEYIQKEKKSFITFLKSRLGNMTGIRVYEVSLVKKEKTL